MFLGYIVSQLFCFKNLWHIPRIRFCICTFVLALLLPLLYITFYSLPVIVFCDTRQTYEQNDILTAKLNLI